MATLGGDGINGGQRAREKGRHVRLHEAPRFLTPGGRVGVDPIIALMGTAEVDLGAGEPGRPPKPNGLIDQAEATFARDRRDHPEGPIDGYGPIQGLESARIQFADFLRRTLGVEAKPEEIVFTNGSQEGLATIGKMYGTQFGGVETLFGLEEPGYVGAYSALSDYFQQAGQPNRIVPLPADINGLLPGGLVEAAERYDGRHPGDARKMVGFVVQTDYQNPQTGSMDAERRAAIISAAQERGLLVVEDLAYAPILPNPHRPIAADLPEQTILLMSTSKWGYPDLRLGAAWIPNAELRRWFIETRFHTGLSVSRKPQIVAGTLAEHSDEFLPGIIAFNSARQEAARRTLAEELPEGVVDAVPGVAAALFRWIRAIDGTNMSEVAIRGQQDFGVKITDGAGFYIPHAENLRLFHRDETEVTSGARLNVVVNDEETTREGIRRVTAAIDAVREN